MERQEINDGRNRKTIISDVSDQTLELLHKDLGPKALKWLTDEHRDLYPSKYKYLQTDCIFTRTLRNNSYDFIFCPRCNSSGYNVKIGFWDATNKFHEIWSSEAWYLFMFNHTDPELILALAHLGYKLYSQTERFYHEHIETSGRHDIANVRIDQGVDGPKKLRADPKSTTSINVSCDNRFHATCKL